MIQYLCLDLLLAFVNDMAARAEGVCSSTCFVIIFEPNIL